MAAKRRRDRSHVCVNTQRDYLGAAGKQDKWRGKGRKIQIFKCSHSTELETFLTPPSSNSSTYLWRIITLSFSLDSTQPMRLGFCISIFISPPHPNRTSQVHPAHTLGQNSSQDFSPSHGFLWGGCWVCLLGNTPAEAVWDQLHH